MACKDQRRLAIEPQLRKQLMGAGQDFDAALFGIGGIVLPDMIEMGEFGSRAPKVVPNARQNILDLRRRFFRGLGGTVWATHPVSPHPRYHSSSPSPHHSHLHPRL